MRIYFTMFFLLGWSLTGLAQYKPAVVKLKSGDSISGIIGDAQKKAFKYKTQLNGKVKKVAYPEIDYVQILDSHNGLKTYKFFQLDNDKKYTQLQQLSSGKNAELYSLSFYVYSSFGAAGAPMGQEVEKYFVKRPSEESLTLLGIYDPIPNTLRGKVMAYVSDCPELVDKILNRDFRIRRGLAPIFEFYNSNCDSFLELDPEVKAN